MLILLAAGCEKSPYRSVSGTVTFQGKLVSRGEVQFMPDSTKGNRGPTCTALIKDGNYATPKGKGIVGGDYVLMISGYQAPSNTDDPTASDFGKMLFDKKVQYVNFKSEDQVHEIVLE
jgi:hypothetical protein